MKNPSKINLLTLISAALLALLTPSAKAAPECRGLICVDHKVYFPHYNSSSRSYSYELGRVVGFSQTTENRGYYSTPTTIDTVEITSSVLDANKKVKIEDVGVINSNACAGGICSGAAIVYYDGEDRAYNGARVNAVTGFGLLIFKPGLFSLRRSIEPKNVFRANRGDCVGTSGQEICVNDTITGGYNGSGGMVIAVADSSFIVADSENSHDGNLSNNRPKYRDVSARYAKLTHRDPANERLLQKRWEEARIAAEAKAKADAENNEISQLVRERIADVNVYNQARANGSDHKTALLLSSGPAWYALEQTPAFFTKLGEFVYRFDAAYMASLITILPADATREQSTKFVLAALLPYLKHFGYQSMKGRYIDTSVNRIEGMLKASGYGSIHQIESSMQTRKLCMQMLAASFQSARDVLNETQRERANTLLAAIGKTLAGSMRVREMEELFRNLPEIESLIKEMAQNPYLQGRSATDLLVLEYLKNS